ncbi:MAG: hypothetical protein QXW41_08050 [Fervidicoccaceae archaeon]
MSLLSAIPDWLLQPLIFLIALVTLPIVLTVIVLYEISQFIIGEASEVFEGLI